MQDLDRSWSLPEPLFVLQGDQEEAKQVLLSSSGRPNPPINPNNQLSFNLKSTLFVPLFTYSLNPFPHSNIKITQYINFNSHPQT